MVEREKEVVQVLGVRQLGGLVHVISTSDHAGLGGQADRSWSFVNVEKAEDEVSRFDDLVRIEGGGELPLHVFEVSLDNTSQCEREEGVLSTGSTNSLLAGTEGGSGGDKVPVRRDLA